MVAQSKKKGGMIMKFKKFMRGILIGMCVLALSGCGVLKGGSSENTDNNATNDNTVNDSKDNDTSNVADNVGTSDNTDGC